jgi:hypothetical protein
MKIADIITEATKLRRGAQRATPDMQSWPELNNNNSPYAAYRFGIALAGSPDRSMDKNGPIGGDFTTIGYTTADQEILDFAAKSMGVTPKQQTTKDSLELDNIQTQSPVQARGPIQRKK